AASLDQIKTIFACPGSTSVADLQTCLECGAWTGLFDQVEAEYSERGTFVPNGPGALQTAVNAAAADDKLLIGSGGYREEVTITTDGLSLVGCGGANNQRPVLNPPATQVEKRGIKAQNVDGLLFQSIEVGPYDSDGIFVAQAQGVSFRDIVGTGNRHSRY